MLMQTHEARLDGLRKELARRGLEPVGEGRAEEEGLPVGAQLAGDLLISSAARMNVSACAST